MNQENAPGQEQTLADYDFASGSLRWHGNLPAALAPFATIATLAGLGRAA